MKMTELGEAAKPWKVVGVIPSDKVATVVLGSASDPPPPQPALSNITEMPSRTPLDATSRNVRAQPL